MADSENSQPPQPGVQPPGPTLDEIDPVARSRERSAQVWRFVFFLLAAVFVVYLMSQGPFT